MQKIGIYGGTFDPPHKFHRETVFSAVKFLGLDKIIVMPTFIPPHKEHFECADAKTRLKMCEIEMEGIKNAEVSLYEIEKGGKSYTYQTVEHFKEVYKDAKLFFIVGEDMLVDFKTWRFPERILKAADLAVVGRKGVNCDYKKEKKYLEEKYGKSFIKINYVGEDVSSTKIRVYKMFGFYSDDISKNLNDFIDQNKVYKETKYIAEVKKLLTEKRYKHTANVVVAGLKKAAELNLNREDVFTACTLHDVAKYLDKSDYVGANIDKDIPKPVVHAFLGAYYAEKILKIENKDIINAIKYHTSGRANMSDLEKLVFVADMVEEGRCYEGVDKLRKLYEEDFNKCFIECLKEEMLHLKNKGGEIYKKTIEAYDYYVSKEKK